MPTIFQTIKRLLPQGSNKTKGKRHSWASCPIWPPDLFAVSATLVHLSGCYALPKFSASCSSEYKLNNNYLGVVTKIAEDWELTGICPKRLTELWKKLISECDAEIGEYSTSCAWHEHALYLMAISDAASIGLGFSTRDSPFPLLYRIEHIVRQRKMDSYLLPYVPISLCIMVSPDEACVQPKTITPDVGCSLRSLSHNLALLPSRNIVTTSWLHGVDDNSPPEEHMPLILLLIPFPFDIPGTAFHAKERISVSTSQSTIHNFFEVDQVWLKHQNDQITANDLFDNLVKPLLNHAMDEVGQIHGIVFPELALTDKCARSLAEILSNNGSM